MTSCCGTYTVVGVNIEREMVLSPNDEEVANSFKKHTQFKTRIHTENYCASNFVAAKTTRGSRDARALSIRRDYKLASRELHR